MKTTEWKRSYNGIKAVMNYIGLKLITTPEELDLMEIPINKNNRKGYSNRKVIVSKNGIISSPTVIKDLMTGHSGLLTQ